MEHTYPCGHTMSEGHDREPCSRCIEVVAEEGPQRYACEHGLAWTNLAPCPICAAHAAGKAEGLELAAKVCEERAATSDRLWMRNTASRSGSASTLKTLSDNHFAELNCATAIRAAKEPT